jgi:hypothetical protein
VFGDRLGDGPVGPTTSRIRSETSSPGVLAGLLDDADGVSGGALPRQSYSPGCSSTPPAVTTFPEAVQSPALTALITC